MFYSSKIKNWLWRGFSFSILLSLASQPFLSAVESSTTPSDLVKEVAKDSSEFAFSVYTTLTNPSSNLLFSPYSMFSCLSMVYFGARGDTAKEIYKALHLSMNQKDLPKAISQFYHFLTPSNENSYQLIMANGMWLDRDTFVLSDFRHAIQNNYKAKLESINFNNTEDAISIINEWISNETKGKIPRLLQAEDISSATRVLLTNAIYFQGNWVKPFDIKKTTDNSFFVDDTSSVQVKMMEQTSSFPYFENETLQLLSMPFGKKGERNEIACVFLLPKKGFEISDLENAINVSILQNWLNQCQEKNISIRLPKFCFDQRFSLNQNLQNLGISQAFTPSANFSGIDGMRDLFLSKVVHEAFFSLDENGVTAAAATGAAINLTAVLPDHPPIQFFANRPFLFFIIDLQTKCLLFMGKLQDPSMAPCE